MIGLASGSRVWLASGVTDLRKGMDGLSTVVEGLLGQAPLQGDVYVFRGRRADRIKLLWFDGTGICLLSKRLEQGHFVWPASSQTSVTISAAQLAMLLEGIDWSRPRRTFALASVTQRSTPSTPAARCT